MDDVKESAEVVEHLGVSSHVGFFLRRCGPNRPLGNNSMSKPNPSTAQQIAHAACAFERHRTGQVTQTLTVVLCENMLFITLRGALSPAEQALARSLSGAAQVQEFHRELFAGSSESLRREIQRITGVEVHEATVQVFKAGTVVLVFLLAQTVPTDTWIGPGGQP
jgi:uncharacterized protein YbcI